MKSLSFYIVFVFILLYANIILASENFTKYTLKTVVIDAGHGGKDPGTSGTTGREKNVVLSVALKLGNMIESNFPNVKVVYTRTTDVFIELNERANIANKHKADLFISIHCNSACYANKKTKKITCNNEANGTEVYVMGLSKTAGNLDIAKRENEVILMEDNYTAHYEGFDPNSPESHIIFSLYQNAFLEQSISFASKVLKNTEEQCDRVNRGVKQDIFLVLWKTSMPSVLIETGYITNRAEEKFLLSDDGQKSMANSIFTAFKEYKDELEGNVVKPKEIHIAPSETMTITKDSVTENKKTEVAEVRHEPTVLKTEIKKDTLKKTEVIKPEIVVVPKTEEKKDKAVEVNIDTVKKDVPVPVITELPKTENENMKKNSPVEKPKPLPIEKEIKKEEPKKEEPKKNEPVENKPSIVFKVQFTVSDRVLNLKTAPYSNYKDIGSEKINTIYKYTVGNYTSLEQATARQNEMRKSGFKDSFVVAYHNGNRIPMANAMKLLKK